jgi:hypothetical protein
LQEPLKKKKKSRIARGRRREEYCSKKKDNMGIRLKQKKNIYGYFEGQYGNKE